MLKTLVAAVMDWVVGKLAALISSFIRIVKADKEIDKKKEENIEKQKEAATDEEFDSDSDDSFR